MESKERKAYLDALRILAFAFVVFNHVAGQSMRLYEGVGGAVALFMLYISKSAIPLFLMVSGATMLGREEPYAKTAKRLIRIVLVLVLASLFYYGMYCLLTPAPFVFSAFFDRLYHYQMSNSLWYLYAYIGLLLMLPILQRMTAALGRSEYLYFAFWTLLFTGGMPLLQALSPLFIFDSSFQLTLFSGIIGMSVLGCGMRGEMRFTRLRTAAALALPVCLTGAMVALTMRVPELFGVIDNAFSLSSMTTACCLFYLFRFADAKLAGATRLRACLTHVGRRVFCAYLLADFAIERLQCVREALVPALKTNLAGAVYVAIVFLVCMLAAEGLTRLPGLKRLL